MPLPFRALVLQLSVMEPLASELGRIAQQYDLQDIYVFQGPDLPTFHDRSSQYVLQQHSPSITE